MVAVAVAAAVASDGHTFVRVRARTPTTKVGLMYGNICGETEVRIFPGTVPSFPPRYIHHHLPRASFRSSQLEHPRSSVRSLNETRV